MEDLVPPMQDFSPIYDLSLTWGILPEVIGTNMPPCIVGTVIPPVEVYSFPGLPSDFYRESITLVVPKLWVFSYFNVCSFAP